MSKFPINYIHNIGMCAMQYELKLFLWLTTEMDKKRLSYLIHSIEDDMKLTQHYQSITHSTLHVPASTAREPSDLRKIHPSPDLQSLFDHREEEVEQCNMLLLLMLSALEYSIPPKVMRTTLETAKLTSIG